MTALARVQELAEGRGAEIRMSRQRWAGAQTGLITLAAAYAGGAELAAADAQREASDDRPLQTLIQSGRLSIVSSMLVQRLEL